MSPCFSFSLPCLSFSFSVAVSLFHPCLASYLTLSHHASLFLWFSLLLLSFFLSFSLTPCLPFYLFSRSLSHPCLSLSLSLFFLTLIFLSFSLSPIPISLSHSCLSFHLFSLPSLSSSSLPPTHVSISIFVSPLSLLLPLCGSLLHHYLSLPIFLSPTDVSFFYILSLSLTTVSLFPSKEREHKIIL